MALGWTTIAGLAMSGVKLIRDMYNGTRDKFKMWKNVKERRTLAAEREAERARKHNETERESAGLSDGELLNDLGQDNRGGDT